MPEVLQSVHADFKNSQVKTLSFLTYLMRVNGPLVLAHKVLARWTIFHRPTISKHPFSWLSIAFKKGLSLTCVRLSMEQA